MRLYWMRLQIFYAETKHWFRRVYWTLAIGLFLLLTVGSVAYAVRNPHIQIFGDPSAVLVDFRDVFNEARQVHRTNMRVQDFSVLLWLLNENYPFLEMVERGGVDLMALAETSLAEMEAEAYYWAFDLVSFVNERFFNEFDRLGNVRLVSEPRGNISPWMLEPYFFGYRDWRFDSVHYVMDERESNFATGWLDDGIAYLQIESFIDKGFDRPSWSSFWHFRFDEERAALEAFFAELDAESLVIDIRGVHSGFGEYFVPFLLAPNLREPVGGRFYAMHSIGDMATRVGAAFREWYEWGAVTAGLPNLPRLNEADAADLHYSFEMDINIIPLASAPVYDGQIYLLVDSGSFSGPNYMYLQLAQDAGWRILYQAEATAAGWGNSYIALPHSGFNLRFNPLYFTDAYGRAFEEMGAFYYARVTDINDAGRLIANR